MAIHQEQYYGRNRHSDHAQNGRVRADNNSSTNEWSCPECTFLNPASKTRCDMCLTAKPLGIKVPNGNINNNKSNNKSNNKANNKSNNKANNKKASGITFTTSIYDSPRSPSTISTHHNGYNYDNDEIGKVPKGPIFPPNIKFNPKKPISKQSILERWMIAQMERASGQQPAICITNSVMLTNLARVRAPTTCLTLQNQINENTSAVYHANNLDAGDWTDDEEDELSGIYPSNSPRSQNSNSGYSPTPSDNDEEIEYNLNASIKKQRSYHHLLGSNNNNNRLFQSDDEKKEDRILNRTLSTNDATEFTYNHKKLLDKRRRKKTRNKSKKQQSIIGLWYKSQLELKQGRNPTILNKFNITVSNIRQHNPKFRDFQRRKSHHEKAATYLQVTGDKLHTNTRIHIANDDDDQYDEPFTDTEDNDSNPNTPNSNTYNSINMSNNYSNSNNFTPYSPYSPYNPNNQYVE